MRKLLLQLMLLGVVAALGAKNQLQQVLLHKVQLPGPYLEVAAGSNLSALCRQWQHFGLTAWQCSQLKLQSLLQPELRQIQAGVYQVRPMTLAQLLSLLRSGKVAQFSLTLREGQTIRQNLATLQQLPYLEQDVADAGALQQLLRWPADWGTAPVNAEGLLFPDTYFYTAHTKLSTVLQRAHQVLLNRLEHAWQQRQANLPLNSRYQLLTLAAIIEKESGHLPEKTLIASVFVNRLNTRMRLQTDPTVIYGLGDRYQGDIKKEHLKDPHLYNTYVHAGLPPGPIALVSQTSLDAAANPASSDKLYFVAKGDGTHYFSASLPEHNAAVRQYILGKKS